MAMSVVGVGVDIVHLRRFQAALARTPRLVARVFTDSEIALSGGAKPRPSSLAARWAAKEAVAKAKAAILSGELKVVNDGSLPKSD